MDEAIYARDFFFTEKFGDADIARCKFQLLKRSVSVLKLRN